MWAVLYGGKFDGTAVLVEGSTTVMKLPEDYDIEKDDHDFTSGEFEYERSTSMAVGWNRSGIKQRGLAFTPRVLETMG